jgi:hypothetical protein
MPRRYGHSNFKKKIKKNSIMLCLSDGICLASQLAAHG